MVIIERCVFTDRPGLGSSDQSWSGIFVGTSYLTIINNMMLMVIRMMG